MIRGLLRRANQRLNDLEYEEGEARKLRMRLENAEQVVSIRRKEYAATIADLQAALNTPGEQL